MHIDSDSISSDDASVTFLQALGPATAPPQLVEADLVFSAEATSAAAAVYAAFAEPTTMTALQLRTSMERHIAQHLVLVPEQVRLWLKDGAAVDTVTLQLQLELPQKSP